jgi:CPA2 family monovalent cation:H+ antiporter-2
LTSFFPSLVSGQNEFADIVVMDLAIIMVVAAVMLAITYKLRQPMVIGYIIAGLIIGPYTLPFSLVSSIETVSLMAEIGIILLLFTVGTEYPIAKLRSIGRKALVIAMSEALGTFAIGYVVGQQMGLALFDSLFLALSISVTSTVIVMRVLEELGMIKDEAAYLLLGIAVIEDIIIISMLAILQSVASTGDLAFQEIAIVIGVVLAFIGGVLYLGSRTIPKLVDLMGKIILGYPTDAILRFAKEERVDMIVIGSVGLSGMQRLKALGSISRGVTEKATCPVLIVH